MTDARLVDNPHLLFGDDRQEQPLLCNLGCALHQHVE